jgi:DNA mismatch repair protein MSH4
MCWMFRVSEALGMIDMLQSFTTYITLNDVCVRPVMSDSGPIAIKSGRHPLLEKILLTPFIPNDTFLTETHSIQVVTGANGAGKTTYLEQVALISIMGHIGCFVPASYARLRRLDSIMTKLSSCNEIGYQMGDFFKEAEDVAFILRNASQFSLIIVDEFGRGTSPSEGTGLCWAVIEKLLEASPFMLFATHFSELIALSRLYPHRIKHLYFGADKSATSFSHRIQEETSDESIVPKHYGVTIARMARFPEALTSVAESLSKELEDRLKVEEFRNQTNDFSLLLEKLDVLKNVNASFEEKKRYLKELQLISNRVSLPKPDDA